MRRRRFLFLLFIFLSYVPVLAQVDTGWIRRYNGPGNDGDFAYALAVDDSGNVYVTGESVGSGSSYDYVTIKYSANGDTLWARRYNGPANDYDVATAIAVDGDGNVYVTGHSWGGLSTDFATVKYTPNGDTLWVRRYNGPGNLGDGGSALAVDDSENVYVTGISWSGTSSDYTTIKYAPNGDTLWVRWYNGPGNGEDMASSLAVDNYGDVYITGWSLGNGTNSDYATLKYAPNGDTLWVRRYNGPGNLGDGGSALAVDDSGSVYVTGISWNGTSSDYTTIKYAPNGDTLWVRQYNGPGNDYDYGSSLVVDVSGNVYVTGRSGGSGTSDDYATALALDTSGNIYVTGLSVGIGTSDDYATIKYAPNGDILWVRLYNGLGNDYDVATALGVDGRQNVYVTGYSWGIGTLQNYVTIKYNKFGCAAKAGDANSDYKVNLSDIIFKVNYVFKGGARPDPLCSGDDNADNEVNLPDIIYLVNFVFKGGPGPLNSNECCLE
ncbi:MAG: hypothetical protein RBG1_1C00001G1419 [candidate division Zixibacteria bacterium RBG-1]|nr:MAG: hypothetical protein RBG1_1C00001G1419 [candidate division Zixibacteria bacterium RBG-1]OGC84516.1 MAG: hypothetical protein A2V73_01665 [candidate division Zixibacteria bacterium RBG_19FT_COMBO_42_43]